MKIVDLKNYFNNRKDSKNWRETNEKLEGIYIVVAFRNDKIDYDLEFLFSDNDDNILVCQGVVSYGLHEYREEGYLICKYRLPFTVCGDTCPRLSVSELTEDMLDEFISNLP
jgi:hypothetical protein